jgi:hypothetical protein
LKFDVVAPAQLVAIHNTRDLMAISERFGIEDLSSDADAFCGTGFAGWNVIGNYSAKVPGQAPGDDIMLCQPERWLRRIK